MKNVTLIAIVIIQLAIIAGCKKDNNEAIPNTPDSTSNNNNNNSHPSEPYFIEFTIDSTYYNIHSITATPTNSSASTVVFSNAPIGTLYTLHQLITGIFKYENGLSDYVTLHFKDTVPYTTGTFNYTSPSYFYKPSFTFMPSGTACNYVSTQQSVCNLTYTRIDTISGGKVEGTFNFTELDYADNNLTPVSQHHVLTNGKFSFVIQ